MAKLQYLCVSFCFFLLGICIVFAAEENEYPSHSVRHLRDVGGKDLHEGPITDNRSNPQPPSNGTSNADITVKTKTKTTKTNPPDGLNITKVPLMKDLTHKHLLGENGSGIRNYNITSSTIVPQQGIKFTTSDFSTKHKTVSPSAPPKHMLMTPPPVLPPGVDDYKSPAEKDSDEWDDEFSISKFDVDVDNGTFAEHNVTQTKDDHHIYYNSTFTVDAELADKYWVDMSNRPDVTVNKLLSESHRRAATVNLTFDFPFYGHLIRNITIATGGFLYTGDYVHSWLAATQYIAPLMANFDTSISNTSFVKYVDNGTAFIVEWVNVNLQDDASVGTFTFQTTLLKNGDIVFVYKNMPIKVEDIHDEHHPVKIGVSDAYIIDRTAYTIRRKTIYEYHRVTFENEDITNNTVIYLTALPTCLSFNTCDACMNNTISFKCKWCPTLSRCSSGLDRKRHSWIQHSCDGYEDEPSVCRVDPPDFTPPPPPFHRQGHAADTNTYHFQEPLDQDQPLVAPVKRQNAGAGLGVSGVLAVLFLMCVVGFGVIWVVYAYRNPHTTSGQILIKYRPTQWRWRRGEARYTAATIHM